MKTILSFVMMALCVPALANLFENNTASREQYRRRTAPVGPRTDVMVTPGARFFQTGVAGALNWHVEPNAMVDGAVFALPIERVFSDEFEAGHFLRYPSVPVHVAQRPLEMSWCRSRRYWITPTIPEDDSLQPRGAFIVMCHGSPGARPFIWWGVDHPDLESGSAVEAEDLLNRVLTTK